MPGVRCSFTVNASGLSRAIMAYASQVQNDKSKTDIVREQMSYAIRAVIDLTPFDSLAQGRQIVHRDLHRAVKPYGGEDGSFSHIRSQGLRERLVSYLRSGQYAKIKDVFSNIGGGYYSQFTMEDFSPEIHHRAQSRRGRVEIDGKILTPQLQEWKAYLDHLQGQVGRARGGWAQSAEAVGLSLPQWVTRWRFGGSVSAQIEPNRVTFNFVNSSVFIPDYRDKVETALAGREKAMANDLRRALDGAATHAGFGR